MSPPGSSTANAVLVACSDAAEYPQFLETLSKRGVALSYADNAEEALQAYTNQQVLLAQPDMAATVIDRMPTVRWVQSTWAGIAPLLNTQRQDFILTGIKDVFGPQMAEYSLGYILAHELQLNQRLEKQQARHWWHQPTGKVGGKTLGIMGLGSIGRHIARVAEGFGLSLIGLNRTGTAEEGFDRVFAVERLHDFLALADYVVAVVPDTPATTGLMNAAGFAAMKPTALFINIGRGNLVDEADLVEALAGGELAAAVLDVFRTEPLPADSPLWNTPNLLVTGHVAARSWPQDIAGIFLENFQRFQQQQGLKFVIDRERGY